MNSIFHEIYGQYYKLMDTILKEASQKEISLKRICEIVEQDGFSESSIYFTPEATSQSNGYNLLVKTDSGFRSVLRAAPVPFITGLQKRYIKTILTDDKISLFLDTDQQEELNQAFRDTEPLFNKEDLINTEIAGDKDNYSDPEYISNFRTILAALRMNNALSVCYDTGKGSRLSITAAPYKIEYSVREGKFRLCAVRLRKGRPVSYYKINIARIRKIDACNHSFDIDFESFIAAKRRPDPLEIEIHKQRNGFERIFIELSNYERISSYDEVTDTCSMKIYYMDDDESELLIQMLSYGPVIKVLGPGDFREKYLSRICSQLSLMTENGDL